MIIVCLSVFINACSSTPELAGLAELKHPAQIVTFELKGKMGIKAHQKSQSATLLWTQNADHYHLKLSSYFGVQVADIKGNNQSITIKADNQVYQSNDPETLIYNQLGWRIPLHKLANWVKGNHQGVVLSKYPNEQVKSVLIRTSSTEEWQVDYLSYTPVGGLLLPNKIKCRYLNNTIILHITSWNKINQ